MTGNDTNEKLILAEDRDTGRITVDREAFREFNASMTRQLRQLIKRWKPYAAPKAGRITQRMRRHRQR
jgi:hypothetical protein